MDQKTEAIGRIVIGLAEYYDKQLTTSQLDMYVDDLMDLDPSELLKAVKLYRRDPKNTFFPIPGKLRGMLRPSDDQQARESVSRIIYALRNFSDPYGHSDERITNARDYIGELGWLVVKRLGGWISLSQADDDSIGPVAQAQWRELAISLQARDRLGISDEAPRLPSSFGKPIQIESQKTIEEPEPSSEPKIYKIPEVQKISIPKKEMSLEEIMERRKVLLQQADLLKNQKG